MTLHTYTSQPMSLPSINFLHLKVSEIQPGQTFSTARMPGAAHPDSMAENNTPTALKSCGVKTRITENEDIGQMTKYRKVKVLAITMAWFFSISTAKLNGFH